MRKPDEMERQIRVKAQRNSYLFLMASLLLWSLYEGYKTWRYHSGPDPLPCLLLTAAALVQMFSQLVLTRRAVKDDEDSFERGPLLGIIALACAVAGVAATVAASALLLGVRV